MNNISTICMCDGTQRASHSPLRCPCAGLGRRKESPGASYSAYGNWDCQAECPQAALAVLFIYILITLYKLLNHALGHHIRSKHSVLVRIGSDRMHIWIYHCMYVHPCDVMSTAFASTCVCVRRRG